MKRIVYIQYTNPAAYPPLIHSSAILAERGWEVLFLAIPARGAAALTVPRNARVHVRQLGSVSGGTLGSIKYACYAARALVAARHFRANWCYASDALSAPIALASRALLRTRIVYHEHDAPPHRAGAMMNARNRVGKSAEVVVAPSAARLALLPPGSARRFVVWNCPRRSEVAPARSAFNPDRFRMVYHGSLSRERLTPAFIDALARLPEHIELHVMGYQTQGHRGYAEELKQRARAAGVGARFFYQGVIPERVELMRRLRDYDLGIATIDAGSSDPNLETLAGASNKAFEYMASGMPFLVSPQRDWQQMFVEPGYAGTCNPADAASIADAVLTFTQSRERTRAMGEAGRQRVLHEWNYDAQFAPVLAELEQ